MGTLLTLLLLRLVVLVVAERDGLLHPAGTAPDVRRRYDALRSGCAWPATRRVLVALGADGDPELGLPGLGGVFSPVPGEPPAPEDLADDALATAFEHIAALCDTARDDLSAILEPTFDLDLRIDEQELEATRARRRRGSGTWYTPPGLVDLVVEETFSALDLDRAGTGLTACDPACGGGRFLLAWARRLADHLSPGGSRDALVEAATMVYGVDVDPVAVGVARSALWLMCGVPGPPSPQIAAHVLVGDSLLGAPAEVDADHADAWCRRFLGAEEHPLFHWHLELPEVFAAGGFAAVVGNPPFLTTLRRETSRSAGVRALLAATMKGLPRAYTDLSALFLVQASRLVRPHGAIGLVQPLSVLSAQDAEQVRRTVSSTAALRALWFSPARVFSAEVATCALVLQREGPDGDVRTFCGPTFARGPDQPCQESWSTIAARTAGVPHVALDLRSRWADRCTASAGFRDQFYGLRSMVVEDEPGMDDRRFPRLVTAGLIDPGRSHWGVCGTRFDGRAWAAPRVDLDRLTRLRPDVAAWVVRQLLPKILVAPQGSVLEAVVDEEGTWVGSVPVVAVVPHDPGTVWQVAAGLSAPCLSAHAAARHRGTGMSATGIRFGVHQVLDLPEPPCTHGRAGHLDARLVEAGEVFQQAQRASCPNRHRELLLRAARLADAAYASDGSALEWWRARLPPVRAVTARREEPGEPERVGSSSGR